MFSFFGMGPPSPPKDADKFKQCVIDFKAPLLRALMIRTNAPSLRDYSKEEADGAATLLTVDFGQTTPEAKAKLQIARDLRSYLRGGDESTKTTSRDTDPLVASTFTDIRLVYVDYMTRALERLVRPDTPCKSFERMKNLIVRGTATDDTAIDINKLIADGKKVMEKPDAVYTPEEIAVSTKVADRLVTGAVPTKGGRKTRRRHTTRRKQQKRVKMSRRK